MQAMLRPVVRLSLLTVALSVSMNGFASAFMLQEQNAVQTGDFGAGGAAIAEDASTAWYNPAGLIRLDKPQVVVAANGILFDTRFSGTATYNNTASAFGTRIGAVNAQQNINGVSGGSSNFVPVFHAAYPINPNVVAGFSVTTPFGLSTNYGSQTYLRYSATETRLRTIDLSPSLGIKLNEKFSFGLGLDEQRLLANLNNNADLNPSVSLLALNTTSQNEAADWAMGWHAGLMYQPTNATRFGLAYHSKMVHHATGHSELTGPLADPNAVINIFNDQPVNANSTFYSADAKATIYLPASTMLSAYHDMNDRWAVDGSLVYTQWSILKNITMQNVVSSQVNSSLEVLAKNVDVTLPQNFHNTWRASVGTSYKFNDQWLMRGGVGFDQSPVNNSDRNIRLPDGNRYAVALGARYKPVKSLVLDAGWTHEFIQAVNINNTTTQDVQSTTVVGHTHSYADVIGLQATWSFA